MTEKTATEIEFTQLGDNVNVALDGKTLVIKVDTTKDYGLSKSGKTHTVASNRTARDVPGLNGFGFGLNVWKK